MPKPSLAAVTWMDAHGSSEMFDEKDVDHKPYQFTSVGFLVRTDAIGVSLAGEIGEDGKFRDHVFIPRLMVVKEWLIGPLRHPRKPPKDP